MDGINICITQPWREFKHLWQSFKSEVLRRRSQKSTKQTLFMTQNFHRNIYFSYHSLLMPMKNTSVKRFPNSSWFKKQLHMTNPLIITSPQSAVGFINILIGTVFLLTVWPSLIMEVLGASHHILYLTQDHNNYKEKRLNE